MALWGSKDAGIGTMGLGSHLSLNYATKTITGSGTTFGRVGAAATGDILVIGSRVPGGTFYGTAVITSIASTTSLSIGSTAGLSGDAISNVALWKVNESPTYGPDDPAFSTRSDADPTYFKYAEVEAQNAIALSDNLGVGVSVISVSSDNQGARLGAGIKVGDFYDTATSGDGAGIVVDKLDAAEVTTIAAVAVGDTVFRFAPPPAFTTGMFIQDQPGTVAGIGSTTMTVNVASGATSNYLHIGNLAAHNLIAGDKVVTPKIATAVAIGTVDTTHNILWLTTGASHGGTITVGMAVTATSAGSDTIITMSQGAAQVVNAGLGLTIPSTSGVGYVSLGATIPATISAGAGLSFTRYTGGFDNYIYGISNAQAGAALSTTMEVASSGWVGVQTYIDSQGNLRVKKETLVSMSGISTENRGPFPAYPNV